MHEIEHVPVIPPKGSGRPKSKMRLAIEALEVGDRVAFRDKSQGTIAACAFHVGKRLGRRFATRIEAAGLIAVYRAS